MVANSSKLGLVGRLLPTSSDTPLQAPQPYNAIMPAPRYDAALSATSAVQSELARLRFQVDHLKEENEMQASELAAAQGVFSGSHEVSLYLVCTTHACAACVYVKPHSYPDSAIATVT
eukprot:5872874-Prymnesium_polylepis.2